jgi:hypothetical protein
MITDKTSKLFVRRNKVLTKPPVEVPRAGIGMPAAGASSRSPVLEAYCATERVRDEEDFDLSDDNCCTLGAVTGSVRLTPCG